jgi:hypothetical protein
VEALGPRRILAQAISINQARIIYPIAEKRTDRLSKQTYLGFSSKIIAQPHTADPKPGQPYSLAALFFCSTLNGLCHWLNRRSEPKGRCLHDHRNLERIMRMERNL